MSSYPLPLVSVIVPISENQEHILRSLQSIDRQNYPHIELIILNHPTNEEDRQRNHRVCSTWNPSALPAHKCLILTSYHTSFYTSIQDAVQAASGTYLTFLMPGDTYAPDRIATLIQGFEINKRTWGFSNLSMPSTLGQRWHSSNCDALKKHPTVGLTLLSHNLIVSLGNLCFSRDLFEKIGHLEGEPFSIAYEFAFKALFFSEPYYDERELYTVKIEDNLEALMAFNQTPSYRLFCQTYLSKICSHPPLNPFALCQDSWPREFHLFAKKHEAQESFLERIKKKLNRGKSFCKRAVKFILQKLGIFEKVKAYIK